MAYTKRGYLYQSKREGRKVRTEYLGKGSTAELLADMAALAHQEREAARKAWGAEKTSIESNDAALAELGQLLRVLTDATLLAEGYHSHKRQWRRRNGKQNNGNG